MTTALDDFMAIGTSDEVREEIKRMQFGEIRILVRDGRVVTCTVEHELRVGRELQRTGNGLRNQD